MLPKPEPRGPKPPKRIARSVGITHNRQPRCSCGDKYSEHSYGAAPSKPACLKCAGCRGYSPARKAKPWSKPRCKHCGRADGSHGQLGSEAMRACPGYEPARRGSKASRRTPLATLRRALWNLFRVYVYERDGAVCISCGEGGLVGWNRQAGHLFNAGQSSLIRWHPKNVHVQCCRCNVRLRGNKAPYALEFVARYGAEEFKRLGGMSRVIKKWTAPEVSDLICAIKRGGADYEAFFAEKYEL